MPQIVWSYRPSTSVFTSWRVPPRRHKCWTWLSSMGGLVSHSSNPSISLEGTGDSTRCRGEILPLLDVSEVYQSPLRKATKITPFDPTLKHWDCLWIFQIAIFHQERVKWISTSKNSPLVSCCLPKRDCHEKVNLRTVTLEHYHYGRF